MQSPELFGRQFFIRQHYYVLVVEFFNKQIHVVCCFEGNTILELILFFLQEIIVSHDVVFFFVFVL